jgi:hypothetical protein
VSVALYTLRDFVTRQADRETGTIWSWTNGQTDRRTDGQSALSVLSVFCLSYAPLYVRLSARLEYTIDGQTDLPVGPEVLHSSFRMEVYVSVNKSGNRGAKLSIFEQQAGSGTAFPLMFVFVKQRPQRLPASRWQMHPGPIEVGSSAFIFLNGDFRALFFAGNLGTGPICILHKH